MADPIRITITAVTAVLGAAKAIVAMIDKEERQKHQKNASVTDLEASVNALKEDMSIYGRFLNTMFAEDANQRARVRLCSGPEGCEALNQLDVSLEGARRCLEQTEVVETALSASESNRVWPAKRPPIGELVKSLFQTNFAPNDDTIDKLLSATKDVDIYRGNCKCSFKRVWYLYQLYQQPPNQQVSMESIQSDGIESALNDVEMAFYQRPFTVSAEGSVRVAFNNLSMLNRTSENSTKHMKLMKDIGHRWAQSGMDRNDFLGQPGKPISKIQALGRLQTSLFELLWSGTIEQMKRPQHIEILAQEKSEFKTELYELEKALQDAIFRAKKERFAIAFCGMVKAGTSLFLNALIGEPILPSNELPSTAWPCRLRHVPGQTTPMLTYDEGPFISGLKALQKAKYGHRLRNYQPPSEDIFDAIFQDEDVATPTEEEIKLRELYAPWVDLHAVTRKNLEEFESPYYVLPKSAKGHEDVKRLLGILNDIIRLCFRFKLVFKMDDVEWPLLTVEFNSLGDHPMDGIYEFIDLPGLGEQFETFSFEAMVRLVAKDSNAIVPIISFKELARSDWKKLPDTVSSGFGARANIVICTHLDQIHGENLNEQLSIVSKVFWPGNLKGVASNDIIPCSSLMGLSARALLDLSRGKSKPQFTSFWDPKRKKVSHPCAEKILGVSQPEQNYERMPTEFWNAELEREMKESGLPDAIQKLAREMVDQAKQRALIQECQAVCKQLRKMITAQERKLLEARRTKRDFDAAKKEFEDARANLYALINTWNLSKTTQEQIYKDKLDRVIKALSQKAESFIPLAIENTLNDWSLGSVKQEKDVESSRAPETTKATMQHSTTVLILESAAHAEEFLCLSQTELTKSLNELRRDFVISVRKMAEEARAKHFQDLKDKIKYLDPKMQPEFRKEIIEDLNDQSVNIRQVAFKQIRNKIKIIKTWGRNKQTIYLAMDVIEGHYREEIVKPWIKDLARESEKSLIGTITASSQVARTAVENALAREDARYKRESEERIPNKYGVVQNMVALNSSLWAAESALQTIWKELLESLNVMGKAPLNTTESIVEETLDTMHTGTESVLIQGESREGERTVMPFPQAEQMEGRSSEASILRGKNSEVLGSGSESPGSALEGIKTSVQQYTHAATQTLAEGSDKESDSSSSDPSSTYGRVNGVDVPLKYAHAAIQTQVEAVLEESYPFHPGHLATVKEDPDPLIPMLQDLLHQRRPVELYNVTNISNHPFAYGGYAQIYAGEFQGRQVAVKCITPRRNRTRPAPWEQSMSRRVDREIEVWSALSHPNILDCLGYYCNTKLADFPCIVSPLCVHGSLDIYLRESPNITDAERLRLVSQTSLGIAYLHDLGIIHGDLKPLNILVDEHYQVRLCDFGLVRALEGLEPTPTPYIATPLYMAPELSDYRVSTFAGDIWAFGCIALEVIEGLQPYARRQNEMRTYGRAYRNQYPADKSMSRWPQSDFKEAAWALMKSCWNQFPFLRPPIKSMVCQLQMMEEMLPLEE